LIGVVMVDHSDGTSTGGQMAGTQNAFGDSGSLASTVALLPSDSNTGITLSTNRVSSLQPEATLFGSSQNPLFQPAGFMTPAQ
jgi:hypothetical protein